MRTPLRIMTMMSSNRPIGRTLLSSLLTSILVFLTCACDSSVNPSSMETQPPSSSSPSSPSSLNQDPDQTSPTWISNALFKAELFSNTSLILSWTPALDHSSIDQYHLLQVQSEERTLLKRIQGTETTQVIEANPEEDLQLELIALDPSGNRSSPLELTWEAARLESTSPSSPFNPSAHEVHLTWPDGAQITLSNLDESQVDLTWPAVELMTSSSSPSVSSPSITYRLLSTTGEIISKC